MAINKVIYFGEVLVDMSQVTVKPENLLKGETALDSSGKLIVGTMEVANETFNIKLEGTIWNSGRCYVIIDGVKYYAAQTIEVAKGTEIIFQCFNSSSGGANTIKLNNVGVASMVDGSLSGGYASWTYTHTVASEMTVTSVANGMVGATINIVAD